MRWSKEREEKLTSRGESWIIVHFVEKSAMNNSSVFIGILRSFKPRAKNSGNDFLRFRNNSCSPSRGRKTSRCTQYDRDFDIIGSSVSDMIPSNAETHGREGASPRKICESIPCSRIILSVRDRELSELSRRSYDRREGK